MKIVKYAEAEIEPGIVFDFEKAAICIVGSGEMLAAVELSSEEILHIASELIEMSRIIETGEPPIMSARSVVADAGTDGENV